MAVGGDWGGQKGIDKDAFRGDGQTMEIDWVSVEQKEWPTLVPACCGGCGGGQNFCSPRSGTCYETKAKNYYAECPASEPVPSPAPGLIAEDEPFSPENLSCCGGCSGGKHFCSPRSGNCYQTKAKEYYAECPAQEPGLNLVDEDASSPEDAPSCEEQWNNLACSGQFGHEECHTCGERIEFLKSASGGRKTDAEAKASVAKDFISQCGACGPNDDSTKITTEGERRAERMANSSSSMLRRLQRWQELLLPSQWHLLSNESETILCGMPDTNLCFELIGCRFRGRHGLWVSL